MRRDRANDLIRHVLRSFDAGQGDWPLSLVTEVYVFGSFARGAIDPHDVDLQRSRNLEGDSSAQYNKVRQYE
jgi:hypothetical protein